jgi:ubiquinol-cytochrome c reductase cytochrome b subunit
MRLLKSQSLLRLVNSYIVDNPQPANISYFWNFGSLLGLCLVIQILSGVFLAMHYTPHVDFAFNSVEHIMRDVSGGYILRYTHANVASFFFIFVYLHIARGLYYSSYKTPRSLVWNIGVIILLVMIITGFLGYVLPYGQMSLWGWPLIAPNAYLILNNFNFIVSGCLDTIFNTFKEDLDNVILLDLTLTGLTNSNSRPQKNKISALERIGPHNKEVISIIFGSLLGDCHGEYRNKGNGTRFCFYQESSQPTYLFWLHNLLSDLGYCTKNKPKINTRLGVKGVVRKIIRFKTWTYSSFNWIHDLWYTNNTKIVPLTIGHYLSPLALAIWIMDDGFKVGKGLKLCTNSFSYSECILLVKVLFDNFNLKSSIQSNGKENQYIIYIWAESMPLLREIILPYVHPSMKHKINI